MSDTAENTDALLALFAIDAPVPIRRLYGVYSEAAFKTWRLRGVKDPSGTLRKLETEHKEAVGICVTPSVLKAVLETITINK